jgi:hypothetical protein
LAGESLLTAERELVSVLTETWRSRLMEGVRNFV